MLIIAFSSWQLDTSFDESKTLLFIGAPIMLAWILSIIGISKILKSRKEKKTFQWYFGLMVNRIVLLTVMIALGINMTIIAKFFSLI